MSADAIYRVLLRAYPRRFRTRFEADMRAAFNHEYAAARRRGRGPTLVFWLLTVSQALWFGLMERDRLRPTRLAPAFTVDWRDAWRSLIGTPGITVVAILSLALGIGANLALFTIANSLMLKPLPVREPGRLVLLEQGSWTNPIWEQIRERQDQLFDGAFAWSNERFDLAPGGVKDLVEGACASGRTFEVLGVPAFLGRTFSARDDARGGGPDGPVAVISYGLWQERFAGAPDVIGRRLTVERVPFTIVGVTPPGFFGAEVGRSWSVIIPIGTEPVIKGTDSALNGRTSWWLQIMARLKPGQTLEQAAAALRAMQADIRLATLPAGRSKDDAYLTDSFVLSSSATGRSTLRGRYTQPLAILMAVVGAVLLIACANIANLLVARASARRHDLSLRLALGASRWRIARQLLAETFLLAAAGTAFGLVMASWCSALLVRQLGVPGQAPFLDLSADWRLAVFTIAVAVTTAVLFGLAPAMGVSQIAPSEALKEQERSVAGDRGFTLRNTLVVAQVALSLVLVVVAGLFLHTFAALARTPLGFDPAPLVVVTIDVQRTSIAPAERAGLFERLREVAAATPGVENVGISVITPVSGSGWNAPIEVGHAATPSAGRRPLSWVNAISPEWFPTYGIRVVAGRGFTRDDRAGAATVTVVNEAFVQQFFKGENPLGREVKAGQVVTPGMASLEVIGVVPNAIYRSARAGITPTMYVPLAQVPTRRANLGFTVRSSVAAGRLARDLGDALTRTEPSAAFTFRRMDDLVDASLSQERLLATLAGSFGGLALVLAALGLYGVTSYSVSRRRAEIGIRMALGADRVSVARLVMRRVAALLTVGLTIGVAVSAWASRFVGTLLFGLEPRDARTFVSAAIVLIAVGALAGWLPARRASRSDPMYVLRNP